MARKWRPIPMPGEVINGGSYTVVASAWHVEDDPEGPVFAVLLIQESAPFYVVALINENPALDGWWRFSHQAVFPNIVPAAEAYNEYGIW